MVETPFLYRTVLGWIERISSVPFQRFSQNVDSSWTARCEITDRLVQDYKEYFEFMKETQLNYMVQWGIFGENWPNIKKGVPAERASKIQAILNYAHSCGVRFLLGFSPNYGMMDVVKESPQLARVNKAGEKSKTSICPSNPKSQKWMKEILTYMLSDFDLDGLSLEPIGRCYCEDCNKLSDAEYTRLGYPQIISFVRDNFPNKTIFSYFGRSTNLRKEETLEYVKDVNELSGTLDFDPRISLLERGAHESMNLKLAFRNWKSATWITPPWSWDRLRWFLPQTLQETRSIKEAYDLGAIGYTWSCAPLANPGIEVTTRFRASLLLDPSRDGRECLEEVLREVYKPTTERALATLVDVFEEAEKAYPWDALPRVLHSESFDYLNRLNEEELASYGGTIKSLEKNVRRVKKEIEAGDKASSLLRCLGNVLKDVENPPTYPREVQLRFGTIPARKRGQ